MRQFKKAQVIMLSHNNISTIITKYLPNTLSLNNDLLQPHANQHLYIISDDEIKKGDWGYHTNQKSIIQIGSEAKLMKKHLYLKKVIATTDTSLFFINLSHLGINWIDVPLPQPSQQYIEKYVESYNKGEVITDVLVEYDWEFIGDNPLIDNYQGSTTKLKVNSKDNTITIKKLKNNWNREEVIN